MKRFLAVLAAVLLVGTFSAYAQVTATLTGTVTMDNAGLPGVTVTITSPNMQGTRTTTTDVNGNYNFAAVPPGTYRVAFEMEGMTKVVRNAQVGVAQTGRADAELKVSTMSEAITVTAAAPAVLETTEVQTNLQQQAVTKLPNSRTVTGVALLAPGTNANGPNGGLVMSGAPSDQNLIMVDGAVIQENLRGQTHGLFIEDAIQETTVLTGAISAEYGRFTGGVVNSITKSGGNEFHGSYRDNFSNPSWTKASNWGEPIPKSTLGQIHEATVGGRVVRDRLWFFTAGRLTRSTSTSTYSRAGGPFQTFPVQTTAHRLEGKLTGQITPKYSVVGTFLDSPLKATNNCQSGCLDPSALDPDIQQGNNFATVHFNGIVTNNWLVEALYSRKTFEFIGFGGTNTDPIKGTPIAVWTLSGSRLGYTNAPIFCGSCGDEKRNNNAINLKSTYFWATKGLGTHNIVAGYERWAENRYSNNYQSPTNFIFNTYEPAGGFARDPQTGLPLISITGNPDGTNPSAAWITYWPVLYPSLGSNLKTVSGYVNDKWDFNTHWSFNIGARYDKNDSLNSLHQPTSKDSMISPRVGLNYDLLGNGKVRFTAGYNVYAGRLAETVSGASSPAGSPANFTYEYRGPDYNNLTPSQASQTIWNWFQSQGGTANKDLLIYIGVPGFQTRLNGLLKTPNVNEYTVGAGAQLGNGYIRGDYIDRKWKDFYVNVTNMATGQVTEPTSGAVANLTLVQNTNDLSRTYKAIQLQGQYRFFTSLNLSANYTYSKLRGNAVQESASSGPVADGGWIFQYPELQGFRQNNPVGYLGADQRHKGRVTVSYDIKTPVGSVNVGAIERIDSGAPYSLVGAVDPRYSSSFYGTGKAGGVQNPGYAVSGYPTSVSYYFSGRGQYNFPTVSATDLSATYSIPVRAAEVYVQGYVFNVLDQQTQVGGITTVRTATTKSTGLLRFNPFVDTPVECPQGQSAAQCTAMGANWQKASNFGAATSAASYQAPRSWSFAVGARF